MEENGERLVRGHKLAAMPAAETIHMLIPQLLLSWRRAVCMHGPLVQGDCSRLVKQEEGRTREGHVPSPFREIPQNTFT